MLHTHVHACQLYNCCKDIMYGNLPIYMNAL